MSDIYPAEDLWLANNSMGAHLRETLLALPCSEWEKEDYLNLIAQLDDEGHDDFTRVRELLGLATGKDNGWYTLRIGELKAMLALAGGDLDQAPPDRVDHGIQPVSVLCRAHQLLPLPANPPASCAGRGS